jgi:hypothetical protein
MITFKMYNKEHPSTFTNGLTKVNNALPMQFGPSGLLIKNKLQPL